MKFLLMLIVLMWNIGRAQTSKITGQLIDFTEAKIPAYCGYQTEYGILKIRIDKDFSYLKAGDTIYIFQACPREIMEREVGNYLDNNLYSVDIGQQLSKADFIKAVKVFRRDYPDEHLSKIRYGNLSKLD